MMDTIINPAPARDNAGYAYVPAPALKPGCRGAACPAFATCSARAAARMGSGVDSPVPAATTRCR
jgi:hypothetical protein